MWMVGTFYYRFCCLDKIISAKEGVFFSPWCTVGSYTKCKISESTLADIYAMPSPQQVYITVESSKFPTIKYSFFFVYIINGWDFNRDKGVAKREEKSLYSPKHWPLVLTEKYKITTICGKVNNEGDTIKLNFVSQSSDSE